MSIEVSGLKKMYGEQAAVNDISFRVEKGEIVGFLGPNGAGKSTTMKMLTGYLEPDGGSAVISGIPVREQTVAARKKIGYLPEANPLYYDMYVREYLGFVARAHKIPHPLKRVEEVILLTGLSVERAKKIGQLSKGYKQRVGLAAALIHDPEVLILDEPTSGLDPNQIVEIRQVIREQGVNKTVLFSSHILQEAEALCNRVIIINKGEIAADDTLPNLRNSGGEVQSVTVEFGGAVDAGLLRSMTAARQVQQLSPNRFVIDTAEPGTVRRQLLELSLQHNLNIVSLHTEGRSLEEVFRAMTK